MHDRASSPSVLAPFKTFQQLRNSVDKFADINSKWSEGFANLSQNYCVLKNRKKSSSPFLQSRFSKISSKGLIYVDFRSTKDITKLVRVYI